MKKAVFFILIISICGAKAQTYKDAQVWFNLYLEKKINKRFLIHLNQQDRSVNNASMLGLAYADFGITYKFTKNIKILADYVLARKQSLKHRISLRNQAYFALIIKKDVRRWRFMYRNMLQTQYNSVFSSKEGYIPYYYDRSKFTVKYELTKRWTPYIAQEFYTPLNNPKYTNNRQFRVDRMRSFVGVFLNTYRHQWLELYFLYQWQTGRHGWYNLEDNFPSYPTQVYFVYGFGYSIEF